MRGTAAWHEPTTENPRFGDTEIWEIWNLSGDAHPMVSYKVVIIRLKYKTVFHPFLLTKIQHVHLVYFELVGRWKIDFDSGSDEGVIPRENLGDIVGDGTFITDQCLIQHNGNGGDGWNVFNPTQGEKLGPPEGYVDANYRKDVIIANPGEIVKIKMTFDRYGRWVWHCHVSISIH